jgi:predicted metalloprotease with PDZ domain
MITYNFYQKNPASHYVYIDLLIDGINNDFIDLQLPAWRPGRYELGNFAKNIKRLDAFNEKEEILSYSKLSKDLWRIETNNCKQLKVTYSYYAAELTAGSCFADTNQIYINPVHCCLYVPERMQEEHRVHIIVPEQYKMVSSLPKENNMLIATSFDELADSPFIAGTQIQSDSFIVNNITFYLHFNGVCKPGFDKIKNDFSAFIKTSIAFWGDFPYPDYHFIFQITPYKYYHGVEHKRNTVIAIGPGYELNSGATYEDVLGVSCHELFHVWNIKTIRPKEMLPYDFTKENYARTGYVYEGFTTYYGDKLLLSSGVFTDEQYFKTLEERLIKHFHNYGRYNLSVAHSSWETWLDGYVPGAPYRKTNIYDEGCLIAFMLDVKILQATGNKKSLRDVCVLLYERFAKKNIGYTEQNIPDLVKEVSGQDFTVFFRDYVYGTSDFESPLQECFDYLGLELVKSDSLLASENLYGFKTSDNGFFSKVTLVAPYSPAWKAGLFAGDEVMAVNGMVLKNNLNNWLNYFSDKEEFDLLVNSGETIKNLTLSKDKKGNTYFFAPKLSKSPSKGNASFGFWKQG